MQSNIKVTLSLPEATNLLAEKFKDELHLSKSEVFARAMKLFAQEQRKEKIRKACIQMAQLYITDPELKELNSFVGDYRETV
jgi:hypothetical protein